MESRFGIRYTMKEIVRELPFGRLYEAADLSLNRRVLIYELNQSGETADSRASLLRAAAFVHDSFMHMLDIGLEPTKSYAVFKACEGELLVQLLRRHPLSADEVLQCVYELGQAMLEAAEEGFYGFSVLADNIWLGNGTRLMPVHYWESVGERAKGSLGLCGLMGQLLMKDEAASVWSLAVEQRMRLALHELPLERTDALLSLIDRTQREKLALTSFLVQLRSCLLVKNGGAESFQQQAVPAGMVTTQTQRLIPEEETADEADVTAGNEAAEETEQEVWEQPKPWRRRMAIVAGAAFIFVLVFIGCLTLIFNIGGDRTKSVGAHSSAEQPSAADATTKPAAAKTESVPGDSAAAKQASAADAAASGPTSIPKLIGLVRADAEKQALAAGLHYSFAIEQNDAPQGTVFKQEPAPEAAAVRGDSVRFWVSKGK